MNKGIPMKLIPTMGSLVILSLACNLFLPDEDSQSESTPTAEADTSQQENQAEASESSSTEMAEVIHLIRPNETPARYLFILDSNSSSDADTHQSKGIDRFDSNRFERPFTANEMDYRPDLDILVAEVAFDDQWIYFAIEVQGPHLDSGDFPATYAVELDLDLDGDGDWLIAAGAPIEGDWSTDGVHAYFDSNDDVGGEKPTLSERLDQPGDGFEEEIFSQGQGDDPDAAWARLSPDRSNTVEIAVRRVLIENDSSFLWGVWADDGGNLPALMDINDNFSAQEAGSPLASSSEYPLKAVALIDNTCRLYFGFTPSGAEPGLCAALTSIEPTATTVVVLGDPDLACISLTHEWILTSDSNKHVFTYTIANQGEGPVEAGYSMIFRIIPSVGNQFGAGPFEGPALAAGESYTGVYVETDLIDPEGNYKFTFVVDSQDVITETDESNNICIVDINVINP